MWGSGDVCQASWHMLFLFFLFFAIVFFSVMCHLRVCCLVTRVCRLPSRSHSHLSQSQCAVCAVEPVLFEC